MEPASCHLSDAQNFNVVSRFWEYLCTPHITYEQAIRCEEYMANILANKNVYYSSTTKITGRLHEIKIQRETFISMPSKQFVTKITDCKRNTILSHRHRKQKFLTF